MKYLREKYSLTLLAMSVLSAPTPGWSALVYYGGPVLSNAEVVMVNWGSNVPSAVQTGMPAFYSDTVQSDYWTIFREYATNIIAHDGLQGSNQQIGLGSFAGVVTISPVQCSGTLSCTVTAAEVSAELTSQVTAGVLPAPTTDEAGNVNTVYMVHFSPQVTIALNSEQSCVNFCGASATFSFGGLTVPAGIIPDQGGSCSLICGDGAGTYDQAETYTSMFILADLVADPLIGSAASVTSRPVAWFDTASGGIGDICFYASGSNLVTLSANGNSYTVGRLWSNQQQKCLVVGGAYVVKPSAGPNGSISANTPQAVDSGATTSFTVTPDAGYTATVGGTCGGTLVDTTYTTDVITADCSVIANFIDRIFADGFEAP